MDRIGQRLYNTLANEITSTAIREHDTHVGERLFEMHDTEFRSLVAPLVVPDILAKYGQHTRECATRGFGGGDCDCGLNELLGEPKCCMRILDWQMPFDRCERPMPCPEHDQDSGPEATS